jgi:hypothetical protein
MKHIVFWSQGFMGDGTLRQERALASRLAIDVESLSKDIEERLSLECKDDAEAAKSIYETIRGESLKRLHEELSSRKVAAEVRAVLNRLKSAAETKVTTEEQSRALLSEFDDLKKRLGDIRNDPEMARVIRELQRRAGILDPHDFPENRLERTIKEVLISRKDEFIKELQKAAKDCRLSLQLTYIRLKTRLMSREFCGLHTQGEAICSEYLTSDIDPIYQSLLPSIK